jgi:hypothetical protein
MTTIVNGAIVFDQAELDWFAENYGTTEWAVYAAGVDETITHDMQNPGDDPHGSPFAEASARAYLAEMDARFGPGSPMDRECPGDPLYTVALHHGVPAFGSHEHSYPVQPPDGSLAHPGDCECGATYADEQKEQDRIAAEELAAVEWAVFVFGPDVHLVTQGQDTDDDESAGAPFDESSAWHRAKGLNAGFARLDAANPSPHNLAARAVVLHHGVPVDETTVA